MIRVLFVCLGNICRSPMAESIFDGLVERAGLVGKIETDSAGTSNYHIGELPDPRTLEIVAKYGLESNSRGRQLTKADFDQFDYIIVMDQSNFADSKRLMTADSSQAKLFLMRDFDDQPTEKDVPDPYWSGKDGFEQIYQILLRSCQNFLTYLQQQHPELHP
ncbi:MAG: low molecular weight protein-tyrosine-phosphatase [Bacteroidota bacterium]